MTLEFTILGCGSSAGVPRPDGSWGDCDPNEPRNRRSRCSLMVRRRGEGDDPRDWTSLLVDTAPEMRLQTSAAGLKRLDAVLLTHDHADQTHGLDDIRTFAAIQQARIPVHMDAATIESMSRRFGYIFVTQGSYFAIGDIVQTPRHGAPFEVFGPSGSIPAVTFDQDHGGIRSLGYRFGGAAYSSDVVGLPEESFEALRDLDVWIVDALRWTPHPTHAHVERTLEWIDRVRPKRAILTNLHIDIDYADITRRLPTGVEAAYDGLRFELPLA